jgi:hypothetical protein
MSSTAEEIQQLKVKIVALDEKINHMYTIYGGRLEFLDARRQHNVKKLIKRRGKLKRKLIVLESQIT